MRYVINLLLIVIIGLLGFMVYNSIKDPIKFGEEKELRKSAVVGELEEIRKAQEIFRSITGHFAPTFDSLVYVLKNDSIPFTKIIGDPDDKDNADKFQKIVTYSSAYDSIQAMGIDLDKLGTIPYTDNMKFEMDADTVEYQKTNVAVVEVGTKWKNFMGEFADPKYRKYDSKYNPETTIKFGDMNKPSLSGSWNR